MFGISSLGPADIDRCTYRDLWVRYFLPALRHQRDRQDGGPAEADEGRQRALIDQIARPHTGENWWTPALDQIAAKQRAKGRG